MAKCCVRRCDSFSRKNYEGLSLFSFPKNDALRQLWVESLGSENIKLSKFMKICSKHFEENCINRTLDLVRLKEDAVPTLYPTQMEEESEADAIRMVECRTCLQEQARCNTYKIFEPWYKSGTEKDESIAFYLTKLCHIQIIGGDGFSDLICKKCFLSLSNTLKFIALVKSNDKILKERRKSFEAVQNCDWPKPIQVNKSLTEFAPEQIEIKQEVLSDHEMGLAEEYADLSFGEIKIEPEELVMPTSADTQIDGLPERCPEITNGEAAEWNVEINDISTRIKSEPNSEDEDSHPDVPLDCLLCAKAFKCVSGLKAHVIAMHSYKGVKRKTSNNSSPEKRVAKYDCKTCKRTFTTSTDLMVHETCHNKSVCYSCKRSFDTFKQLTKHRTRCKAAKSEVVKPKTLEDALRHQEDTRVPAATETFKCTQCDEQFNDIFYLQVHQEIHNTDSIEFNAKFDSDSESESSAEKTRDSDSAKDYLEKMLKSEEIPNSAKKIDAVEESLDKDTQASDKISNKEQNPSDSKTIGEIESDIVKESLQKLLQSDDSMDSLGETDKFKNLLKNKLKSNVEVNRKMSLAEKSSEKTSDVEIEADNVKESLQKLFDSESEPSKNDGTESETSTLVNDSKNATDKLNNINSESAEIEVEIKSEIKSLELQQSEKLVSENDPMILEDSLESHNELDNSTDDLERLLQSDIQ